MNKERALWAMALLAIIATVVFSVWKTRGSGNIAASNAASPTGNSPIIYSGNTPQQYVNGDTAVANAYAAALSPDELSSIEKKATDVTDYLTGSFAQTSTPAVA